MCIYLRSGGDLYPPLPVIIGPPFSLPPPFVRRSPQAKENPSHRRGEGRRRRPSSRHHQNRRAGCDLSKAAKPGPEPRAATRTPSRRPGGAWRAWRGPTFLQIAPGLALARSPRAARLGLAQCKPRVRLERERRLSARLGISGAVTGCVARSAALGPLQGSVHRTDPDIR